MKMQMRVSKVSFSQSETTHRSALAQLDALFASLQQRAFAGEL
jgi:hypothetical protein